MAMTIRQIINWVAVGAALTAGIELRADGPFRNRDNKNATTDPAEGTYPVPYQMPTAAEITEVLQRVRAYLETAAPTRVVHKRTGAEIAVGRAGGKISPPRKVYESSDV